MAQGAQQIAIADRVAAATFEHDDVEVAGAVLGLRNSEFLVDQSVNDANVLDASHGRNVAQPQKQKSPPSRGKTASLSQRPKSEEDTVGRRSLANETRALQEVPP